MAAEALAKFRESGAGDQARAGDGVAAVAEVEKVRVDGVGGVSVPVCVVCKFTVPSVVLCAVCALHVFEPCVRWWFVLAARSAYDLT